MSKTRKNKPLSPAHKEALLKAGFGAKGNTGWHHTQEAKDKISFAFTGEKHPMWGRKGIDNPNWGAKHPRALPVLQFTKSGEFIKEWSCGSEARRGTGASNISGCCKNNRKTSGGFRWKYKENAK